MKPKPADFVDRTKDSRTFRPNLMPETMRSLKAFVFDFDGTLAELNLDFNFMKDSLLNLSREFGIKDDNLKNLLILELIDTVRDLIDEKDPRNAMDFSDKAYILIEEIEIEAARKGALLNGTLLLLTTLKERGNAIGIITRNCHAALMNVFPQIENYCDVVISRDKTTHVKPHPDHLIKTLSLLGASPDSAVMIGDHPLDIHLGRKVGTYTVGVLTGYSQADTLIASGADLILNRAVEILDILI